MLDAVHAMSSAVHGPYASRKLRPSVGGSMANLCRGVHLGGSCLGLQGEALSAVAP